jgi:enoyl-[acyl-carrier protein] reductase I
MVWFHVTDLSGTTIYLHSADACAAPLFRNGFAISMTSPKDPLPKVWDPDSRVGDMLSGLRGLVVGVANEHSIAFGCASKLRAFGAELAITYLNEKAKPYVQPLAEQIGASMLMPLDVQQPGQTEAVFERIGREWGRLDFLIHSIAFAPRQDLHGRVTDCSADGFQQAMFV